jgi:hypothetical protein
VEEVGTGYVKEVYVRLTIVKTYLTPVVLRCLESDSLLTSITSQKVSFFPVKM